MAKSGERTYFKKIGKEGVDFTLHKPFSDPLDVGALLHDIGAVFSLLPEGRLRILDLGCGSGWTSSFYARANHDVVGVDIAPEAVRAARRHFKNIANLSFELGDYDTIKYKDEFDAVIFFDSLHHAENETVALNAAYRALKPGGVLIACEPGVGHSKTEKSKEAVRIYGVNERDMPPKMLKPLLKDAGFRNIEVYAYPALVHRVLYKSRNSGLKVLTNISFVRGIIVGSLASFHRPSHGIIRASK